MRKETSMGTQCILGLIRRTEEATTCIIDPGCHNSRNQV